MWRKCGRVLRILSPYSSFTINNLYARRSILPFLLVVFCYKFSFTLQYLWSLNLDSWSQQKHQDATVWWAEAHSLVAQSSRAWGWWASVPPLIDKQECQWCSRHDKDAVIYCYHLLDLQEHREVSQWDTASVCKEVRPRSKHISREYYRQQRKRVFPYTQLLLTILKIPATSLKQNTVPLGNTGRQRGVSSKTNIST